MSLAVATVRGALDQASEVLAAAGCGSPRVDAELLLAHVLGVNRAALRARTSGALTARQEGELASLLARRAGREPLAYVLGEWGFRRLTLGVDARVLIPRPETEVVVERCLALLEGSEEPYVLDVGTGSGAIALAIADEHPGARVTGVDSSPAALAVARENAVRTSLDVELVPGNLFARLPRPPGRPWDLVVSNPPYVRPDEIETLEPEVRDWEPRAALVGVGATEAIVQHAGSVLRQGGALVLEVAAGDARRIAGILRATGYVDVLVTRDLGGRERVVEGLRA